jgi:2-polyprenyl-6-methoxyphenol hydroxylase-like FAD-dependent oxidoreductase
LRSPTSARILVVGAGIAGLGTARALARAGFAAEVVEWQRTWREAGAGIYLPGNAARALRALDLEHRSTIEEVTLDSWLRGSVVLVGDAAHATAAAVMGPHVRGRFGGRQRDR